MAGDGSRRGPLHWLEPWFAAYALAGLLVNGIVPLLIPLTAAEKGPGAVAVVVAAFFVGQLTAPFVGRMADRGGRQRIVFLGSFPVMAAAAIGFGLADDVPGWVAAAAVAGAAAGAAQTLGSVFIVEGHPPSEWDARIGWFRFTFGLGQVAGLTIGAVFAEGRVDLGWFVAGAVILLGTFLGRLGLPHLPPATPRPTASRAGADRPSGVAVELRGRFGRFLLTWLLAMIAVQTILNVLPLVMLDAFHVGASRTATWYLVGSLIGACLYPVCGRLADRHGGGWVLRTGLLVTLLGFAAMSAAWAFDLPGKSAIGVGALIVVAIGYPFDYIGGTVLAARLTLDGQGSAMGLFNSGVAAGAIVGAVVPSFLAREFGYGSLPPMAAAVLLGALLIGLPVLRSQSPAAGEGAPRPS
jgi:MFS family permease